MKIGESAAGEPSGVLSLGKEAEYEKIHGITFGRFDDIAVGLSESKWRWQ
jgi:hypothetical protein